jgi:ankyrin repeat protein
LGQTLGHAFAIDPLPPSLAFSACWMPVGSIDSSRRSSSTLFLTSRPRPLDIIRLVADSQLPMKHSGKGSAGIGALCCAVAFGHVCALAVFAQPQPAGDRIFQAVRTNDLVGLRQLVNELGANTEDSSGFTPLILAAAFGTPEAVSLLLDGGANVNAHNRSGLTALHVAWRDEVTHKLLLDRGADVNAKTQLGATPLTVTASANGTEVVVSRLLEKGADPDAADDRGVTPLIAAAGVGNTAVARLLLQHGANANAYAPGTGQKTATPLMGAAHNGDVELTRLLLGRKPNINAISPNNDGIVKNGPVLFGSLTALHLATADASAAVVNLLLDVGASVDARDARIDPADVGGRQRSSGPGDHQDAARSWRQSVDCLECRRNGRRLGPEIQQSGCAGGVEAAAE